MVNVGKYQNSKRTDSTRPKCQNLAIYYTIYFHGMPRLWMTKRPPKTNTMRLATRRILWSWPSQSVCIVLRACRWDMLNLYRWQFDGRDDHELTVLHPGRLTCNLQITHLERKMIFQTSMIMFHVNLPGCRPFYSEPTWWYLFYRDLFFSSIEMHGKASCSAILGDVIWWLLVKVLGEAGKKPCWSIEGTGKNVLPSLKLT